MAQGRSAANGQRCDDHGRLERRTERPVLGAARGARRGPKRKVKFRSINDPSDFSYLWLANRSSKFVSRIDLTAMSLSSATQIVGKPAQVVRWKPIQDVIQEAGGMTKPQVVAVLKAIKETISDHLPTVNRFYFTK